MEAIQPYLPAGADLSLSEYRYDPSRYIQEKLGWTPWAGTEELPGQQEVIGAYVLALRQQHERAAWEAGELAEEDLTVWKPGEPIRNRIRIEAGHTVGKTKLSSGLVNHFFDCFTPSIIYCFAPNEKQAHDLLWKEVKTDRRGKGLPGRIMDLELRVTDNHFATVVATNDAGGRGTERVQGQHGKYLMFVLDEAEGIPDFVYNAVDSMASGGICIVVMLANPRTRSSRFYKSRSLSNVKNFRISCLQHPNVLAGRELVPGAVRRDYVETMVEKHCEVVPAHDDDEHTFELPFPLRIGDEEHPAGTVFLPNAEFMFRVMGIAPANLSHNTLVPVGRYEAACRRQIPEEKVTAIRMGADVARFGTDFGTLFVRTGMRVWRAAQFWKQDSIDYVQRIKAEALRLKKLHPEAASLHIRVDGGGGFASGVIDGLKKDDDLIKTFPDFKLFEVHFNATPHDAKSYCDLVTEMYAEAAETLKGVRIERPPETLEADLTERQYNWRNVKGVDVKKLEEKTEFRKRLAKSGEGQGRSPDDGDGFILCVAPDHLLKNGKRVRFTVLD